MNHSPFWPLVWKEYRASRAFWLSMAVMGLVAQTGVRWLARASAERDWWLYGIALMISAGFAVGIGGTLFAVEHEERTFALLRVFPLRAKELGWAKLICALIGLCSLLLALWLAASALAGWQPLPRQTVGRLWDVWGLACAEGLAWGILCSLAIRRPLWATLAAVVAVTLAVETATTPFRIALLIAVGLLDAWLLPRWLQGRFPRTIERRAPRPEATAPAPDGWESPAPRWAAPLGRLMWQTWSETVGSVWWVLGFFLAGLLISALVILVLITGVLDFGQIHVWPPIVNGLRLVPFYVLAPLVLLTALTGSLTFSLDPVGRARFLAERGISPRLVWLSRQIVWGGWLWGLLAVAVILTVVPWLVPPPSFASVEPERDNWSAEGSDQVYYGALVSVQTQWSFFRASADDVAINAWLLWAVLFSSYAVAQLVSMLLRRRLLAAVLAAVLSVLAASWAHLMFVLDVPWWWSVLPVPIACLLATWLAASAWLFAWTSWRQFLAPAAVIVASLAGIAVAVPRYRVDEISAATVEWPKQDQSPTAIADTEAAIDAYHRADDLYRAGPEPVAADIYREQLAQAIARAAEYRTVWLSSDPKESWQIASKVHELGRWLNAWGAKCQGRGELDRALDAYLVALRVADHYDQIRPLFSVSNRNPSIRGEALTGLCSWAAWPEQTSERIRTAIHRLEEVHRLQTSPADRLRPWYAAASLVIRDLPAAFSATGVLPDNQYASSDQWIASRLPWERERSLRLLDLITRIALNSVNNLGEPRRENEGIGVGPLFQHDWEGGIYVAAGGYRLDHFPQWLRTTPLLSDWDLARLDPSWFFASDETNDRATAITLALEAWRIDHGQLPDRLDQLVPGELPSVPVDPVIGQPFLYFPRGLDEGGGGKIAMHNNWFAYSPRGRSAAIESEDGPYLPWSIYAPFDASAIYDHPLLWSALASGPAKQRVTVAYEGDQTETPSVYVVRSEKYAWSYETGIFSAGRFYLIPQENRP